jgi:hypothetical protein
MTSPNAARARHRPPADPRDAAEALGFDTGSRAISVEIDDVAVGTRQTTKVARRADPLRRVGGVTPGMRAAAARFVRYREHMGAGLGAGSDVSAVRVQDDGGVRLFAQERAYTAAVLYTRGEAAIGPHALDVVLWVVVAGRLLADYDTHRRWRKGTGAARLVAALERLAREYDCA